MQFFLRFLNVFSICFITYWNFVLRPLSMIKDVQYCILPNNKEFSHLLLVLFQISEMCLSLLKNILLLRDMLYLYIGFMKIYPNVFQFSTPFYEEYIPPDLRSRPTTNECDLQPNFHTKTLSMSGKLSSLCRTPQLFTSVTSGKSL